jgi:hypothetical protein
MGIFGLWFSRFPDETDIPIAERFTLQLPRLTINGDTYEIDPVGFEPFEKWGVAYSCP